MTITRTSGSAAAAPIAAIEGVDQVAPRAR